MENLCESGLKLTINNTQQFESYYDLENKIKEMLSINLEKHYKFIIDKISQSEKEFIDEKNVNFKLNWIFNINHSVANRGDISTSTLQKFFHSIFKEYDDTDEKDNTKNEFIKFKSTFIELLAVNMILSLNGENLIIDKYDLNEYIGKFENKNGFFNIFLKNKGKLLINEIKNKSKDITKDIENDETFVVNFYY